MNAHEAAGIIVFAAAIVLLGLALVGAVAIASWVLA